MSVRNCSVLRNDEFRAPILLCGEVDWAIAWCRRNPVEVADSGSCTKPQQVHSFTDGQMANEGARSKLNTLG
jgi:hypothetical protein